jgi:hypothetical protein
MAAKGRRPRPEYHPSHTSKAHRRPEETPLEHAIMDRVWTPLLSVMGGQM